MSRWFRPDRELAEPQFGEEIYLLGPSGQPDGRCSKVKQVVAEDRDNDIWEVVDSFNQTRYIGPAADGTWLEVEIE